MLSKDELAQRKWLAFIDFSLMFKGAVYRQDIIGKFNVKRTTASRIIKLYAEKAPNNLSYNNKKKRYLQTDEFKPLVKVDVQRTLVALAHGILDRFDANSDDNIPIEMSSHLDTPDISIVARIVQAIFTNKAIDVSYSSSTGSRNFHQLVPHSIFDDGLIWHVRAYDRNICLFKDFELRRLAQVNFLTGKLSLSESKAEDEQWMTFAELQLVPHPKNVKHSNLVKQDFGMTNGVLVKTVRAATAGYLLRHWQVDCSENASLIGAEYQLHLCNLQDLRIVKNMYMAPGYQNKLEK
jgi:hypothetical protein